MDKSQQSVLQKRAPEGNIEQNDEICEDQIVEDYQRLFRDPESETSIRLKDFYKLNDVQAQMVENGNFCVCNYCKVVFIFKTGDRPKHDLGSENCKIDYKFLTTLKKKRNNFTKLNTTTRPFDLKPGKDAVFIVPPFDPKTSCEQTRTQELWKYNKHKPSLFEPPTKQNENLEQSTHQDKATDKINWETLSHTIADSSQYKKSIEYDSFLMHDFIHEVLQAVNHMFNCQKLNIDNKETALEIKENAQNQQRSFRSHYKLTDFIEDEIESQISKFGEHIKKYKKRMPK